MYSTSTCSLSAISVPPASLADGFFLSLPSFFFSLFPRFGGFHSGSPGWVAFMLLHAFSQLARSFTGRARLEYSGTSRYLCPDCPTHLIFFYLGDPTLALAELAPASVSFLILLSYLVFFLPTTTSTVTSQVSLG